jgi:hypothetical protein
VQSERYLGNFAGTFYEVPRSSADKNAPDYQRMRPVATHRAAVTDFCSWRGMLVLAGGAAVPGAGKVVTAPDGKTSLWFGVVDDLWRFGKPTGVGGPWRESAVKANEPSDPYLMTNFDKKTLTISHTSAEPVAFSVEVDFLATGIWREYTKLTVPAGDPFKHEFPAGYGAHWVRLKPLADCTATAEFRYE